MGIKGFLCAVFSCACVAGVIVAPAHAFVRSHESNTRIAFDIPEGPLSRSLQAFGDSAGVLIIFDHHLVDGLTAKPLKGKFTAPVALTALLDATPLSYHRVNHETWAIIESPEAPPQIVSNDKSLQVEPMQSPKGLRDEIIVTASYRAPTHQAGARALYTLDSELLRLKGAMNVAEPIFELPASVASVTSANTALFISAGGLNLADLRGLGPERTLVMVNGRRFVRTSGGNGTVVGVDLNAIPAPFVERIEIVNQGAGAAIGVEAVAGAVNIVTRDEIDGIALTADGGVSEMGDTEEYSFSILAGKSFFDERAKLSAGITYAQEPSLLVEDRPRLTNPFGFSDNGLMTAEADAEFLPGFGGSTFTPNGALAGALTSSGDVVFSGGDLQRVTFSDDGASFAPFIGSLDQLYDWTTDFAALPEIERLIGYGTGSFELSGGHKIYADGHFAESVVKTQIAPVPVSIYRGASPLYGNGVFVPVDNPFIPAGLVAQVEAQIGSAIDGLVLNRRFAELGPRRSDITRKSFQLLSGIEGPLSGDWKYDVSYQYGRTKTDDLATGVVNADRLEIALDPALCATVTGCTPINIFGSSNITSMQANFIAAAPRRRVITLREQIAQAKISGPIFENRGESGMLTAGIDYRTESLNDEAIANPNRGRTIGEFFFPGADGDVSFTELFTTASAPLLVDAQFARHLELGGSLRYVIRQDGDNFINVSGNVRWSPAEGVDLYSNVFYGGRSPNVVESFSRGPDIRVLFGDPCADPAADAVIIENCLAAGPLGVPAGFQQTQDLTLVATTGNPDLDNERVRSQVYGAQLDFHALFPDMPGNLTLNADWRNHVVKDYVSYAPDVLKECYSSASLSDVLCGVNPATGDLFIERDPVTRQVVRIDSTLFNAGSFRANGLDARFRYSTDLFPSGLLESFSLDLLYTYTHRVRTDGIYDSRESIKEGLAAYPRHQLHGTASLGSDALKTVWTVRRRGKALSSRSADIPAARIPAIVYVDAALQARPTDNTIAFVGIENLFDVEPPIVAFATGNTFYEFYDIVGRRFFAGIKAEF